MLGSGYQSNSGVESIHSLNRKVKTILGFCCLFFFASNVWSQTATFAPPQSLSGDAAGPLETWGVSSVDVNDDSCPDIYFGNHRLEPTLYLGNCDGTFVDRSDLIVGKTVGVDAHTTVFGDFHNDGCADAHVNVGGSGASNPLHANQLMFGELNSSGECSGVLIREQGSDAEYAKQRGRSSVPLDLDYDGDLDLATTGFASDSSGAGGGEEIFINDGFGNLNFAPDVLSSGFDGHSLTIFNILADINGDNELDLLCGENSFPRAQCSRDVSAFFDSGNFLSGDLSLDFVIPRGVNIASLLTSTVDAFAEDIDNDGDNDLVVLKRNNRSGNATRLANNTVVESLNTSTSVSPMRCLGIPGAVDIESLVIAGDYIDSTDIRFGPSAFTENTPSTSNASARRFVFNNISRANNIGLPPLPDISDGVDENERGMYIGYVVAEQMWKICDVIGVGPASITPAPQRRFNLYGIRAEFSGPVGELVHEGYDPATAPIKPVIWINNGNNGNGVEFENTVDNGGIDQAITAFALGKGDFDNDGDMDFIASYENYSPRDNHYLYTNDGNGTFTRSRFDGCPTGVAESVAILDANADGRLDAVVACAWFGLAHDTSYAHSLWINNSDNDNQAIMFDVVGNNANRSGIGARITVTDANDRSQIVCTRDVGNTFGRGSQDSEYVHCGVASRTAVDVLVNWPGTTRRDIYNNVPTDGLYTLEEGSSSVELIKSFSNKVELPPTVLPELEINSVTVDESIGAASLSVQLRGGVTSANDISVNCATINNTAIANSDFTAASGCLATIRAGLRSTTITIPIIDDAEVEAEENFGVQLSNASGATIATALGIVTVTDNDRNEPLPVVEASYRLTDESDGEIELFIRLEGSRTNTTQRDITVNYTTEDITAIAGEDYVAVSGTATIPAGSNESVRTTIQIIDDNIAESVEFFRLRLSNAVGATIAPSGGIVTVTDASPTTATPIIGANFRAVNESSSTAVLFIRLNDFQRNNTNSDITVDYTTTDLTAIAGIDYIPVSGTAVIAPGQRNTFINVPIINDGTRESIERFQFQLSNARGAILSDIGGVVTIIDDD